MPSINVVYSDFNADLEITANEGLSIFVNDNSIKESIKNIIYTRRGSALMTPEFGTDIYNYFFRTLDGITLTVMGDVLKQDILNNEPRITINFIEISSDDDHSLDILISYNIISSNTKSTVVINLPTDQIPD